MQLCDSVAHLPGQTYRVYSNLLGQTYWDKFTGTNILGQTYWDKLTGTNLGGQTYQDKLAITNLQGLQIPRKNLLLLT